MSFQSQHADYVGYQSDDFFVSAIPARFDSALQGFIARQCNNNATLLKSVINDIASRIPSELTLNWGWQYLIEDLQGNVQLLCKKPLSVLMDFLEDCVKFFSFSIEEVNQFLMDQCIGYSLEINQRQNKSTWHLRVAVSSRAAAVRDAMLHVQDICVQTLEHLEQANALLQNPANNRDLKDAIRDCLSAMETMLKKISGKNDIKDATTELRLDSFKWGPDTIVKDGLSIWDRIHTLYPDIRHGNPASSAITLEQALYWIERITCFIKYITRVYSISRI